MYLYTTEAWPGQTQSNQTNWLNSDMQDSALSTNSSQKIWPTTSWGYFNGSSRFWSFEKHDGEYPRSRDTFYPYFIIGGRSFYDNGYIDVDDQAGILHSQCSEGKFWYANSSMRIYNRSDVMNELQLFNCPDGTNCVVGPENGNTSTVYFTHSYGGMITMQGLHLQKFTKGPKWAWGASQSPFRGAPAGNAAEWICLFDDHNLGNFLLLIAEGIFKQVWSELRFMNYCRNDTNGSNYTHGLMMGMYAYEGSERWSTDFIVEYKYCGIHPGGLVHDLYWTEYGSDIYDVKSDPDKLAGSNFMNNHANDFTLWMMDYWSCRFFAFCGQQMCMPTGSTSGADVNCSWRGCGSPGACKVWQKESWKAERFVSQGDGMVPLSSCVSDMNKDFMNVNEDVYSPPFKSVTQIEHVKTSSNGWKWSYENNDMGVSRVTIQQANHEDGTGTNGNGMYLWRAPVNWYTNVVNQVFLRQTTSESFDDLTAILNDWTSHKNFQAGNTDTYSVSIKDVEDDIGPDVNYGILDFYQSGAAL